MREQEEREQDQADSSRSTAEFRAFAHSYGGEDPEATTTWSAAPASKRNMVFALVGAGVVVVVLLIIIFAVG